MYTSQRAYEGGRVIPILKMRIPKQREDKPLGRGYRPSKELCQGFAYCYTQPFPPLCSGVDPVVSLDNWLFMRLTDGSIEKEIGKEAEGTSSFFFFFC